MNAPAKIAITIPPKTAAWLAYLRDVRAALEARHESNRARYRRIQRAFSAGLSVPDAVTIICMEYPPEALNTRIKGGHGVFFR